MAVNHSSMQATPAYTNKVVSARSTFQPREAVFAYKTTAPYVSMPAAAGAGSNGYCTGQQHGIEYDRPKSALEHALDFWLGGRGPACVAVDPVTLKVAIERSPADTTTLDYIRWFLSDGGKKYSPALRLGPCRDKEAGLLAIQIENRGGYVPKLPMGLYGPEHTYIGNAVLKTRRVVIDGANHPPTSFAVLFGYYTDEFPDGLRTHELVQQTLDGMAPVKLLADGSYLPIEPAGGRMFYTPLAESVSALKGNPSFDYDLYRLGIITLHNNSLEEIFNALSQGDLHARSKKSGE